MPIPQISKLLIFRDKKSAAENKLLCLEAKKEFAKDARYQKNALRIKNIPESYQNNRIELPINVIWNIFDFV